MSQSPIKWPSFVITPRPSIHTVLILLVLFLLPSNKPENTNAYTLLKTYCWYVRSVDISSQCQGS